MSSISGLFTSLALVKTQNPRGDEPGKETAAVKGVFITYAEGSRRFSLVVALAISHPRELSQGKKSWRIVLRETR